MTRAVARYEYRAEDKTGQALHSVRRNVESVGRSLAGLAGTLAGIAGIAGFGALTKAAIDTGDRVQKLGIRLGASTESLSQLDHVAQLSGTSLEAVAKAMQQTQRATAEAQDGMAQYADAFAALGIDVERFGKLKPEEQFIVLTEALSGVQDESRRTALAMDIMGRSGAEMLQIMDQGAPALRAMMADADQLGLTLSQETADAFAEVNDAMTRFQARSQVTGIAIAKYMGPSIVSLTDWLGESLPKAAYVAGRALVQMQIWGSKAFATLIADVSIWIDRWASIKEFFGASGTESRALAESLMEQARSLSELGTAYQREVSEMSYEAGEWNAAIDESVNLAAVYDEKLKALAETAARQKREVKEQAEAQLALNAVMDAGRRVYEETRTPAEQLAAETMRLNDLLEQGAIDWDIYSRAIFKAQDAFEPASEAIESGAQQQTRQFEDLRRAVEGWGRNFADTLLDGEGNFRGFADSILREMARIALAKATEPLFDFFAGVVEGAAGQIFGGGTGTPEARAGGGPTFPGRRYVVGEEGPELLTVGRGGVGMVQPLAAQASGAQSVRVVIENKGLPKEVTSSQASFDPEGMVVRIITDDARRGGPISQALRYAPG